MSILQKLPIRYFGELHSISLINFSVEKGEIIPHLPKGIRLRDYHGRALVSMVNVELKKMRPSFCPKIFSFAYRHIAFRVLIDDSKYNNGMTKGIWFYRSFTDKPLIVIGGGMLTHYNLELATFKVSGDNFIMKKGRQFLRYSLNDEKAIVTSELTAIIGGLDRAYFRENDKIRMIRIQREKWPIEPIACSSFETNFFSTAKLEGAFRVKEPICYQWLPPVEVLP